MFLARIFYIFVFIIIMIMLSIGIYYFQEDGITYKESLKKGQPERTNVHSHRNPRVSVKSHLESTRKIQSYILPFRVMEQQTAAIRNLYGLQYWASTVNMKVVEPYISNMTFDFLPLVNGDSNPVAFSDLYDRDFYNRQSSKYGHAELVTWKELLTDSPKNTILVLPCGEGCSSENATSDFSKYNDGLVRIVTNPDLITGTRTNGNIKFPAQAVQFFKDLGFHFMREVSIMFSSTTPMSIQTFTHHVLDSYDPSDVTVIFAVWHGIAKHRDNLKVDVSNVHIHRRIHIVGLLPNAKMIQLSGQCLKKVNPSGKKYFGIMVRTEKVLKHAGGHKDEVVEHMMKCAEKLEQHFNVHPQWNRMLSIDLGTFGTNRYRQPLNENVKILYEAFVTSVYNKSWSINKFEHIFDGIINPVVVAQLQRTIAAKSDCLILVGGPSSFQKAALAMYKIFHPDKQEQCIIEHCHYGVNLEVPY